jgi:hypothetical protein
MRSSNFELQIIVNDKPVTEFSHEGNTFIEGRPGSSFKLGFKNNTKNKVMIIPSIDGVSTLDGNSASPDSPGFLVRPYSGVEIKGWTVDSQYGAQFVFHDEHSSYSSQINGHSRRTGVIGMLVYSEQDNTLDYARPEKPIWNPRPCIHREGDLGIVKRSMMDNAIEHHDTMIAKTKSNMRRITETTMAVVTPKTDFELGTGWGDKVDFKINQVSFERGDLLAQMIIYYDSRKNLERRGIKVRPERYERLGKLPQAFEGIGCKPPAGWKG